MNPWFVIIGTGRCGTGYMSKLFAENGLRCGHEDWYNPMKIRTNKQARGLDGDSSWLAVPYLEDTSTKKKILHVTRNPVDVVRSMMGIKFFHPVSEEAPFLKFIRKHTNIFELEDPLERCIEFWCEWNERCSKLAEKTFQIESDFLPLLENEFDRKFDDSKVSNKYNHRDREEVSVDKIRSLLKGRHEKFGY